MQDIYSTRDDKGEGFPFAMKDLLYWVVKCKDGTFIKTMLTAGGPKLLPQAQTSGTSHTTGHYSGKFSDWCHHDPIKPVFEDVEGPRIFVGDYAGSRKMEDQFDFIIDCGKVITLTDSKILTGDDELATVLDPYVQKLRAPRVLKIDWFDRTAPDLDVRFWPALLAYLREKGEVDVLCSCQGGHGRSGTSATALMMCATGYSPLEAITHLRALHCARAIESKAQHDYLNLLGKHLGREENAHDAEGVKDFKAVFLASKHPDAKWYQGRLKVAEEKK